MRKLGLLMALVCSTLMLCSSCRCGNHDCEICYGSELVGKWKTTVPYFYDMPDYEICMQLNEDGTFCICSSELNNSKCTDYEVLGTYTHTQSNNGEYVIIMHEESVCGMRMDNYRTYNASVKGRKMRLCDALGNVEYHRY